MSIKDNLFKQISKWLFFSKSQSKFKHIWLNFILKKKYFHLTNVGTCVSALDKYDTKEFELA